MLGSLEPLSNKRACSKTPSELKAVAAASKVARKAAADEVKAAAEAAAAELNADKFAAQEKAAEEVAALLLEEEKEEKEKEAAAAAVAAAAVARAATARPLEPQKPAVSAYMHWRQDASGQARYNPGKLSKNEFNKGAKGLWEGLNPSERAQWHEKHTAVKDKHAEWVEANGPPPPPKAKAKAQKRKTGEDEPPAPLVERARQEGTLTTKEWRQLLEEAHSGIVEPTVAGGAAPRTSKARTGEDGTTPHEQYAAWFAAWDAGCKEQPPLPPTMSAKQLPDAKAKSRIDHLDEAARVACKAEFVQSARAAVEAAHNLSARLRVMAMQVVDWIESNMPPAYAAELMQSGEDGEGRKRVRELHSPVAFILEYSRADDPQFWRKLGLSPERSEQLLAYVLKGLMQSTYDTNYETYACVGGLPYVSFRGALKKIKDAVEDAIFAIMITEAGHFHAESPQDPLASEDISMFAMCPTGLGLQQAHKILGMSENVADNVTHITDLSRSWMSTREPVQGTDGKLRNVRTATGWRRSVEAKESEPYGGTIAQKERVQHGWLLLLMGGLGVSEERVATFGVPSTAFSEARLRIDASAQRASLRAAVEDACGLSLDEGVELPVIDQHFVASVHYQNMWCDAESIIRSQRELHLVSGGDTELTAEQKREIEHEGHVQLGKNADAKLKAARAELAAAEAKLEAVREMIEEGQLKEACSELNAALLEVTLRKQAEYIANSRKRGGKTLASPSSPCAPLTDGARPLELPPALTHR